MLSSPGKPYLAYNPEHGHHKGTGELMLTWVFIVIAGVRGCAEDVPKEARAAQGSGRTCPAEVCSGGGKAKFDRPC